MSESTDQPIGEPANGRISEPANQRIGRVTSTRLFAHLLIRFFAHLLILSLLLLPALAVYRAFPATAGPVTSPPAILGELVGPGEVRRDGGSTWSQEAGPISLHAGDTVRVREAVSLRLAEGSVVHLSAGTTLEIVAFVEADRRLRLRQLSGALQVQTANPFLEIETPAAVAALRVGSYRLTVQGTESTIAVERGTVVGKAGDSEIPIAEGEEVRIVAGQAQAVRWQRPPAPTPLPGITPLPSPTPMPTAAPPQRIHIVSEGDTLLYIAAKYKTTVEAIVRANKLDDPHSLSIGQKLIIPYSTTP